MPAIFQSKNAIFDQCAVELNRNVNFDSNTVETNRSFIQKIVRLKYTSIDIHWKQIKVPPNTSTFFKKKCL